MTAKKPERIPAIKAVMTAFPWHVGLDDTLAHAQRIMREREIRHLPVTDGEVLIGVVTDRDLRLVENATRGAAERAALTLRDVGVQGAYVVELSEPLDRVLGEMADRRIDSALVVKRGKLAGIFTAADACEQFRRFLQLVFAPGDDDAA